MKKVIFISALAIAAAVSCTKSDIVDTKFNEQISFETYTGRDAMTKATAYGQTVLPSAVGVYGFYTGAGTYTDGESQANLWDNLEVSVNTTSGVGSYDDKEKKYWANESDHYTFLAYAPYATTGNGIVAAEGENLVSPYITYTVDNTLEGVDLLYANTVAIDGKNGHVDMVKPTDGEVDLKFKHALARLTVTATAAAVGEDAVAGFQFDVKEISISGGFYNTGKLTLATAQAGDTDLGWSNQNTTQESNKYNFYTKAGNATIVDGVATDALTEEVVDYSGTVKGEDGKITTAGTKYLMMIPVDFSKKTGTEAEPTYPDAATLRVVYTSIYEGQESGRMVKELPIATNFKMGKAYAINLVFSADVDPITFSVAVDDWSDEDPVTATGGNNPEDYAAKTETTTPEEGN